MKSLARQDSAQESSPEDSRSDFSPSSWQDLTAEIVFTQDVSGKYLSFCWQDSQDYGIAGETMVGTKVGDGFVPENAQDYYQRLKRVLESRIPEHFLCVFKYQGQSFPLELVMSPIIPKDGVTRAVLVMGRCLRENDGKIAPIASSSLPAHPHPSQKLLTRIARKIRRTLDLETIWQQTVDSIGQALGVSRCLMIAYHSPPEPLEIKAEYCHPQCNSILQCPLDWQSEPYWLQAIAQQEPVLVDQIVVDGFDAKSVLVVSTFYQNERNGLICLQQCDHVRYWTAAEVELVQELAEQVGTAIAHATLYQELEQATHAAEEASRLKSEFLASTTHELRTPLNGIIGFLKLILDGMADDPEEQQEFIEEAYKSALHLLDLINDILDLAKIEAGKMEIELGALLLDELLAAVDNFARPQAQQKKLKFKIKKPQTYTPVNIYGNYKRLLQVMLNIVGNALKFTHEGEIIINIEIVKKKLHFDDQDFPGVVKISVADTGIGVSLEKQAKLFENFFQIDGSRTKAYGGTGLGLAISQKLVQAMGGQIDFYSMGEGLGSTVTFTVPLSDVPILNTMQGS